MDLSFLKFTSIHLISLAYLIISGVDYLKKKKIWTVENFMYTLLLILDVMSLVTEIFIIWTASIYPNITIMHILNKFNLCCLAALVTLIAYYAFVLCSKRNQGYIRLTENREIKYWFYTTIGTLSLAIIACLVIIFLPGEFVNPLENGLKYYTGPCCIATYLYTAICIIVIVVSLIYAGKRVKNTAKLPFVLIAIFGTISGVVQAIYPDFIIIDFFAAFCVVLLNFTVENPDLTLIENLNIAKQSADKANKAKSDFLSNMSHEIRTPLNAIVGFSHALAEENLQEDVMNEVNDIIESSNSLLNVINNILDISKMDAGGVVITEVDYNTKALVSGLLSFADEACKKKGLKFTKEIDKDLPEVLYGDNVRIKQIVQNLLSNAIKYTKEGSVVLSIKAIPLKKDCKLYISVSDTGVGINEEDVGKIYNQFNKLNNDLTTDYAVGTGLGLTISKRLLDMMDGSIDFESTAGKGSRFLISFDQKISDKHIEDVQTYVEDELKFFDASDKKILIIDDNSVNLKVAKKLFKDYNNEPELSKDVTECIEKIKKGEKYDLILMDDMMPVMTGSEAILVLRKIPGFNIKTIILTANQTPGIREKYITNGFDDYLAKPLVKSELCYILNKYLNSDAKVDTINSEVKGENK